MVINKECIRKVLLYCEEHIDYRENKDGSLELISVPLPQLYSSALKEEFEKKDILYSVMKLAECKYIKLSSCSAGESGTLEYCEIVEITVNGHQFIRSADSDSESDSLWEKIKKSTLYVGDFALDFITRTAHDVVVEMSREAVRLVSGQRRKLREQ